MSGGGPFAPYQPSDAAKMKVMATLKEMGRNAKFYAKQFSLIGLLFSGSECAIEQVFFRPPVEMLLLCFAFLFVVLAFSNF